MCARSGANCGSLFLDLRFRELVRTLLADHPAHLDAPSLAYFMHNFSETDKLAYMGDVDDGKSSWAMRLDRLSWVSLCWYGILISPFFVRTSLCLVSGEQKRCSTLPVSM